MFHLIPKEKIIPQPGRKMIRTLNNEAVSRVQIPSSTPFFFRLFPKDGGKGEFFSFIVVLYHKSQLFHARNFGQLKDFQFEVFAIPEAVCLPDKSSDFIIEDLSECPECGNAVEFVPNGFCHGFEFRNAGLKSVIPIICRRTFSGSVGTIFVYFPVRVSISFSTA